MSYHPLVEYLLLLNEVRTETWYDLAVKFEIKPEENHETRAKAANDIWRSFARKVKKENLDLEVIRQTLVNGEVKYETRSRIPQPSPVTTDGMVIQKVTTNPYGGSWITYQTPQEGFSDDYIKFLKDKYAFDPIKPSISPLGSGIGTVDISDIHTGAIVKAMVETVKQRQFDHDVLIKLIDNAVAIINSYGFKEVYLFLPGDLIESFTGFNHKDTYKNVQFHQGDMILVAYEVVKRIISNITNLKKVYMVEGNHDRLTAEKMTNSRKGLVQVLHHFLSENSPIPIEYHPFLLADEIDGIYHICTHGDFRPFDKKQSGGYDGFFFKYGKQGIYNVLKTGHYHRFNMLAQTPEYMHYECPSIFTGGLFEEFLGFHSLPGITITRNFNDICSLDHRPIIGYEGHKRNKE